MRKITSFVVGASCRELSRWHAAGKKIWVAVNATAHDLQHIDFVQMLRDSIALWDIDPTYVVIEIT
jgi:EAL domain-containing protein (putative c-di-GMP-specific phosphodiesterase class I)